MWFYKMPFLLGDSENVLVTNSSLLTNISFCNGTGFVGLRCRSAYDPLALHPAFSYRQDIGNAVKPDSFYTVLFNYVSQRKITTTETSTKLEGLRNAGGTQATLNSLLLIESAVKPGALSSPTAKYKADPPRTRRAECFDILLLGFVSVRNVLSHPHSAVRLTWLCHRPLCPFHCPLEGSPLQLFPRALGCFK